MDPEKMKAAYQKLQGLDERLTYKVRPRSGGYTQPGIEQLQEQVKHLSEYAIELREIVEDLFVAIASRPAAKAPPTREV